MCGFNSKSSYLGHFKIVRFILPRENFGSATDSVRDIKQKCLYVLANIVAA